MGDALAIDILGVEFNRDAPDGDGITRTVAFSEDSADVQGGSVNPTGRHGVALLPQFFGANTVNPTGRVTAPTRALAEAAREELRALGVGVEGDIIWHETVPKFLTVTRAPSPPKISRPSGFSASTQQSFVWDIVFTAAFPFLRSVTTSTQTFAAPSTHALVNAGTQAAYPVVTTTSSGSVDIVIGGRHFVTTGVPLGTEIDMWARTVTGPDGSSLYTAKTPASEWLALPPGSTPTQQAGTAGLAFVWHDTYL